MKKGLIASFMVALMLVTVLSAVVTANAITVSKDKEKVEDEEATGGYTITVEVVDWHNYPFPFISIWAPIKVTLKSTDGTIQRSKWSFLGGCHFNNVPDGYEYTFSTESWTWKLDEILWESKTLVYLLMVQVFIHPKTIDNPFIERFPLFNLLLQRLRI
jgi:hypothetical protein